MPVDYVILPKGNTLTGKYDGKICAFAIESSLSGVQKKVGEQNELWYHRTFAIPAAGKTNG